MNDERKDLSRPRAMTPPPAVDELTTAVAQAAAEGALPAHDDEPMPEGEEVAPPGTRTMAIVRWALVALMALAAVGTTTWYFGFGLSRRGDAARARFHCPMHPSVVQDHPGECPICGMDLVPVAAAGSGAAGSASAASAPHTAAPAAGHEGHRHDANDPWFCPMHPEETAPDATGRCPVCGMKLTRRELGAPPPKWVAALPAGHETHRHNPNDAWFCPMHPEETAADATGRCPVCGMKLQQRSAANAAPATAPGAAKAEPSLPSGLVAVDLSPERAQLVGMKTATVKRAPLATQIRTVGTLTTSEDGLARIAPRFSGWIEELRVAQTGEKVEKGQVLATVYSPDLLTAQQEYLNARRWAGSPGGGASLLEDSRRKLELLGISSQEIAEIERAGRPLRALKIRSPVSGYVVQKNAVQGVFVQPGTELFQVADLGKIWLLAEVYEYELGRVRVGQSARLELAAYPGEVFQGKVQFLYPVVDPETRTMRVRVAFRNPDLKLKPGMYGDVSIEARASEGLVVPRESLVDTGRDQYVFLARPNGRFEPRRVKVGLRADDAVEIVSGLVEGDTVVTTGNFLIDSESRLRAAIEGMAPAAEEGR